MTSRYRLVPITGLLVALAAATHVHAQTGEPLRRTASFMAGTSSGDGGTKLALSAALGGRLRSRLGLEVELAYARALDFTLDLCPPPLLCIIGGRIPVTGRTVSLVPQATFDLLPPGRRVRAFVQGGFGAGHVRQRYFEGLPSVPQTADRVERTRSSLTAAWSFGGGATARVSRHLSIGVEVRSLHLEDDPSSLDQFITPAGTLSTFRVGSRVEWGF